MQNPSTGSPTIALDPAVFLTATVPGSPEFIEEETDDIPDSPGGCPAPYFDTANARPQYWLGAVLDVETHTVRVQELIEFLNFSEESLEEIPLVVEPNRWSGVFQLGGVKVGGKDGSDYKMKKSRLDVALPVPLPPGCGVEISLSFSLNLPEQAGIFGFTADQITLAYWYPFIPPYHPERGWLIHPPGAYGEHLAFPTADYQVEFQVLGETDQNILIAAPAPAREVDSRFSYRLDEARTFALAIVMDYEKLSRMAGEVSVEVLYKQAEVPAARAALDTIIKALDHYSQVFGDYPFNRLTVVEIDMFDGMEFDGMFFLGRDVFGSYDGTPQNLLVLLSAHETAHNWWYSQVGNDQAFEPWLDEALCVYSELLFYERYYPYLTDWWWQFRVKSFEPAGPVDVSIYAYAQYEAYRQAVYLRGALFAQAVRDWAGEEAFFEFLQQYLREGRNQVMTAEDFFQILARVTLEPTDALQGDFFRDN